MFGKLGKLLRILGFDTYIASSELMDEQIMQLSLSTNRILVTQDREFYQKYIKNTTKNGLSAIAIYVNTQSRPHQLVLIFKQLLLSRSQLNLDLNNTRCTNCNSRIDFIEKSEIKDFVLPGTFEKIDEFSRCLNASCQKIYWMGNHWKNILNTVEKAKLLL